MLCAAVLFLLLALSAHKHQSRDSGIQLALSLAGMTLNSCEHFPNIFGMLLLQKCLAQCFLSAPPCLTSPWDRWDGKRDNTFNRRLYGQIVSLHPLFYSVCTCDRSRLQQTWSIRPFELEDFGPWSTHDGTIELELLLQDWFFPHCSDAHATDIQPRCVVAVAIEATPGCQSLTSFISVIKLQCPLSPISPIMLPTA